MAKVHEDWQVKLETQTRETLSLRYRSYSTEKTYITWVKDAIKAAKEFIYKIK
ncbi:MAG: hypothetical protein QY310_00845 [Candidatus Jettenia sp. CY-1]|nr:MAG: hypothetical protein QY310_00845 [Candidatus Jettenia sp. CY-1]